MYLTHLRHALRPLFALLLAALLAGCGGEAEKKEIVDLAAQVAALSGDADAKANALAEIAKAGPDAASAVDKIMPLLKDEDAVVRRLAAYALGSIGPAAKAAIPDIKALLDTTDRDQLSSAANALRSIDPASAPDVRIENVSN